MELPGVGLRSSECLVDNADDIFDEYNGEIYKFSDEGRGSKASHDNHSQNMTAQEAGDGSRKKRRKKSEDAVDPRQLLHSCKHASERLPAGRSSMHVNDGQKNLDGYVLRKRRGSESAAEHDFGSNKIRRDAVIVTDSGVQTRAMAKRSFDWLSMLPAEIWGEILGHLDYNDIGRALCVCRAFRDEYKYVWKTACQNLWPEWTERVSDVPDKMFSNPTARWRKCYEMLSLRAAENKMVIPLRETYSKFQKRITPHMRAVLVEWLLEVAQDWRLESSVIFQAVRFLDHYIRLVEVDDVSKFQMIGVSALRLAVMSLKKQMTKVTEEHYQCLLRPSRYSDVCDGAATEQEVIQTTKALAEIIPHDMRHSPNAKMYLRCLWYTISKSRINGCTQEDMHLYVLASFLLEIGQLSHKFSEYSHSSMAAAAISLSLEFYQKEPWPMQMRAFSSYSMECLSEQRKILAKQQAVMRAPNLRIIWHGFYKNHLYQDRIVEWDRTLDVMAGRNGEFISIAFGPTSDITIKFNAIQESNSQDSSSYSELLSSLLDD